MASKTTQPEGNLSPAVHWPAGGPECGAKLPNAPRSRILIVDSDAESHRTLRSVLGEPEYELVEVDCASEAVSAVLSGRIDLVLIDFNAPEIGAIEFCRTLRRTTATLLVPILILSADGSVEKEISAIESGANEFLTKPLQPRAIRARIQANIWRKSVIDTLDDSEAVLFSLAQSVEGRDPELGQHCERIAVMCAAMGASLGLSPQDILTLQRGGYLHDVGKVVIPDSILFKPGRLTPEEWKVMEGHAERGEKICSSMRSMSGVLPIIRHHHERWDGSGYPDKLKGEGIPLLARILQVADIYDALTTARAYKSAMNPESAIRTLRDEAARGWRDPRLVEVFSDILPMFRTSPDADLSRYSLRALANSLDVLRKAPAYTQAGSLQSRTELKLVSGL